MRLLGFIAVALVYLFMLSVAVHLGKHGESESNDNSGKTRQWADTWFPYIVGAYITTTSVLAYLSDSSIVGLFIYLGLAGGFFMVVSNLLTGRDMAFSSWTITADKSPISRFVLALMSVLSLVLILTIWQ